MVLVCVLDLDAGSPLDAGILRQGHTCFFGKQVERIAVWSAYDEIVLCVWFCFWWCSHLDTLVGQEVGRLLARCGLAEVVERVGLYKVIICAGSFMPSHALLGLHPVMAAARLSGIARCRELLTLDASGMSIGMLAVSAMPLAAIISKYRPSSF